MPTYNFQQQFVVPILNKTKPHTIRMPRKRPTKAGDLIYMYTGLRTKKAKKFAESICVDVSPITIYPYIGHIRWGDGNLFEEIEIEVLFNKDGFTNGRDFFDFFIRKYKSSALHLEIIEWDIDRLVRC